MRRHSWGHGDWHGAGFSLQGCGGVGSRGELGKVRIAGAGKARHRCDYLVLSLVLVRYCGLEKSTTQLAAGMGLADRLAIRRQLLRLAPRPDECSAEEDSHRQAEQQAGNDAAGLPTLSFELR